MTARQFAWDTLAIAIFTIAVLGIVFGSARADGSWRPDIIGLGFLVIVGAFALGRAGDARRSARRDGGAKT